MARTLLVVDDSSTIRQAVRLALTGEDWTVLTASAPDEALEILESRRPDAVLCDVTPGEGGDGYEVCRSIRSSAEGAATPVILMGGKISDAAASGAGTTAILSKPFGAAELLGCLEDALEQGSFAIEGSDFEETPEVSPQEFQEHEAGVATPPLEGEEVEIIDLSGAEGFEEVELLEDLEPVELTPDLGTGEAPVLPVGEEAEAFGPRPDAGLPPASEPTGALDLDLGAPEGKEAHADSVQPVEEGHEPSPETEGEAWLERGFQGAETPVVDLEADGEEPVGEFELSEASDTAAGPGPQLEEPETPSATLGSGEPVSSEPEDMETAEGRAAGAPQIDIFAEPAEGLAAGTTRAGPGEPEEPAGPSPWAPAEEEPPLEVDTFGDSEEAQPSVGLEAESFAPGDTTQSLDIFGEAGAEAEDTVGPEPAVTAEAAEPELAEESVGEPEPATLEGEEAEAEPPPEPRTGLFQAFEAELADEEGEGGEEEPPAGEIAPPGEGEPAETEPAPALGADFFRAFEADLAAEAAPAPEPAPEAAEAVEPPAPPPAEEEPPGGESEALPWMADEEGVGGVEEEAPLEITAEALDEPPGVIAEGVPEEATEATAEEAAEETAAEIIEEPSGIDLGPLPPLEEEGEAAEEVGATGTESVEDDEEETEEWSPAILELTPEAAFARTGYGEDSEAPEVGEAAYAPEELGDREQGEPMLGEGLEAEGAGEEPFVDFGEDVPAGDSVWSEPPPVTSPGGSWDQALPEASPATPQLQDTAERAVREALESSLTAEKLSPVVERAVERVVWEVVPQLAERLIEEAIRRLKEETPSE